MGPSAPVTIAPLLVLCCVQAIRVPVAWTSDSAVSNEKPNEDVEIIGETVVSASNNPVPIPKEYFEYPAKKPQFAVEVAKFHGVKNPENHYSAYPIHPYTGVEKPVLGKHKIFDENSPTFEQFQKFSDINGNDQSSVSPASSEYEVFHPYKAEEPALLEIYKDPVLDKIRNDIYNSQSRLQKYEKDAGEPDIQEGEYLESPEQTDRKKFPQENIPVPYEIHRPQRRPIYYRPPPYTSRDRYLNHRFRHPWNQHNAKIRPSHYRPLKSHLQRLRQLHAIKYDDERNQYPQVPTHDQQSEIPDGFDIYQRGKEKYVALRNNVDESINNAIKENHPTTSQKLELQNNGDRTETIRNDDDDEFVPIKNYAQVRKTETRKHLPKSAAYEDAENFDEIKNAPRLREAIKSTKAQTVYTEEGYEDAAYDHEGEEKHAAENEAHGGHLTEKEISGGKFKAPSVSQKYQEANGKEYRDQLAHGEKWKDDDKDKDIEAEEDDYSEDNTAHSIEADVYDDITGGRDKRENESDEEKLSNSEDKTLNDNKNDSDEEKQSSSEDKKLNDSEKDTKTAIERSKRENKLENITLSATKPVNEMTTEHDVTKRELINFEVPKIDINSTFLTADELAKKAKIQEQSKQSQKGSIQEKYPYYFKDLKNINRDSPLKYAENLRFIPKKSKGGTEFYDSRSKILECPEVDDAVDAIPEKLNKDGHPDENDESDENDNPKSGKADFTQLKKNRRLKGLGDKIDCFKAKFFGENPLDSPFFKEEIILNPEPVTAPNLPIYKLKPKEPLTLASSISKVFENSVLNVTGPTVTNLYENLKGEQINLQDSLAKSNQELRSFLIPNQNFSLSYTDPLPNQYVYSDVLKNIEKRLRESSINENAQATKQFAYPLIEKNPEKNLTYISYQSKEDVIKSPPSVRKKRATPFTYEPYKIIKDGQFQESKKTTTTSNISPLIKQLQSSRIIDRVTKSSEDKDQPVKRNAATRSYKDIGRKDRVKIEDKGAKDTSEAKFVDVSIDSRRGEPKYEIILSNHKNQYKPVENKKSMTLEDYESQTNKTVTRPKISTSGRASNIRSSKIVQKRPIARPYYDVSHFLPKSTISEIQKPSASNTVRKIIKSPPSTEKVKNKSSPEETEEEDYEEYDDEEDKTTTTTSTAKPSFRRRRPKTTTTTTTPQPAEEEVPELPKLRLITRFNTTPKPTSTTKSLTTTTDKPVNRKYEEDIDPASPKYREKKRKSSKSTLVTDTKSYGDEDDDMMKDEVDAMIGVKEDMDEYKPIYEKEIEGKVRNPSRSSASSEEDVSEGEDSVEDDDEEISDEDDDVSESEEDEDNNPSSLETKQEITTPEPTKQTLVRTTEAPVLTTETRSERLRLKPIVHKKKIEIHKELPVNKSSPHRTQYKQDYKEVEIIKEMPLKQTPSRSPIKRPQKNLEALELFKDEKLAEEVNKLGAVEVFKENLDLVKGPRHGGNYRSADLNTASSTQQPPRRGNVKANIDADTSQTKSEKLIEIAEVLPARRNHARNVNTRSRSSGKSARLELEEPLDTLKRSHGGNLKTKQNAEKTRESGKSAKFVEIEEDEKDSDESNDDSYRSNYGSSISAGKPLHGGNYRSAKLTDEITDDESASIKAKAASNRHRSKSAVLLSSFAQAVPHLTTTPSYILDPSKRMYYYVDSKR